MPKLQEAPFRLSAKPSELEVLAKYFRVLGDPTRLEILRLIESQERSVNELVGLLDTAQPRVSNHLAVLRWSKFVSTRRDHRTIYYRVADKRVSKLIALADQLLQKNEEHLAVIQ